MRWALLCLYLLFPLSALFFGLILTQVDSDPGNVTLFWVTFTLSQFSQVFFVRCGMGRTDFAKPLPRGRLALTVLMAGLLFSVLVTSFSLSLAAVLEAKHKVFGILAVSGFVGWILWSTIFLFLSSDRPRSLVFKRLLRILTISGLLQLSMTAFFRWAYGAGGLDQEIMTAIGLIGGFAVTIWSFGPGLILLFFRPKILLEISGGATRTAPGRLQFSLLGMISFCLFLASALAVMLTPEKSDLKSLTAWPCIFFAAASVFWLLRLLRWIRAWELHMQEHALQPAPLPTEPLSG
jgi:hypothetical protein